MSGPCHPRCTLCPPGASVHARTRISHTKQIERSERRATAAAALPPKISVFLPKTKKKTRSPDDAIVSASVLPSEIVSPSSYHDTITNPTTNDVTTPIQAETLRIPLDALGSPDLSHSTQFEAQSFESGFMNQARSYARYSRRAPAAARRSNRNVTQTSTPSSEGVRACLNWEAPKAQGRGWSLSTRTRCWKMRMRKTPRASMMTRVKKWQPLSNNMPPAILNSLVFHILTSVRANM